MLLKDINCDVLEEVQHYVLFETCLTDIAVLTSMAHEMGRCATN